MNGHAAWCPAQEQDHLVCQHQVAAVDLAVEQEAVVAVHQAGDGEPLIAVTFRLGGRRYLVVLSRATARDLAEALFLAAEQIG